MKGMIPEKAMASSVLWAIVEWACRLLGIVTAAGRTDMIYYNEL